MMPRHKILLARLNKSVTHEHNPPLSTVYTANVVRWVILVCIFHCRMIKTKCPLTGALRRVGIGLSTLIVNAHGGDIVLVQGFRVSLHNTNIVMLTPPSRSPLCKSDQCSV
jgi:hypothetical protein